MPDSPLRPDELEDYRTEVQTSEVEPDPPVPTPGGDARPWVVLALVMLGVFVVALIAGLALALGG